MNGTVHPLQWSRMFFHLAESGRNAKLVAVYLIRDAFCKTFELFSLYLMQEVIGFVL